MDRTSKMLRRSLLGAAILLGCTTAASAQQELKVGLVASLEGAFAVLGQDGVRGAELALKEHNGVAGGKKIVFVRGSSDASPASAVNATRKLVEQDKVSLMIGPLSGSEGVAVKDYAKTQPGVTFIDGSSGGQQTTLVNPSPNFFRFNLDGAQVMAPLGAYAYEQGYKRVMVIAEDYAFPYSQVQGFMSGFCKAGGKVPRKAWVPIGTKDFSSVISSIPNDVDSLLVVLAGADAVNFIRQYEQAGGDKKIIGGSVMVDQTVLSYRGRLRGNLVGTLSSGWTADALETPAWEKFVAAYRASSKDAFPAPSYFAFAYYNAVKATLNALDKVGGDLSDGQEKFRKALAATHLESPVGLITLDSNRQAIGPAFVTKIVQRPDGKLVSSVVKTVPKIDQHLNLSKAEFDKMGLGSRDVPACP